MITRKYDKEIEALREHFPNADSFTASYGSGHACATIRHGKHTTQIMMTGRYLLTAGSEGGGYTHAEFDTLEDLLLAIAGGKAA